MFIRYDMDVEDLSARQLEGFFEGWVSPPSPETHLRILRESYAIVVARDGETGEVIGFATAISDGVLSAYIPLLEVRAAYRRRGIGSEIMRRLVDQLEGLYMIDLVCDEPIAGFYERLGLGAARAMIRRDYSAQAGVPKAPESR